MHRAKHEAWNISPLEKNDFDIVEQDRVDNKIHTIPCTKLKSYPLFFYNATNDKSQKLNKTRLKRLSFLFCCEINDKFCRCVTIWRLMTTQLLECSHVVLMSWRLQRGLLADNWLTTEVMLVARAAASQGCLEATHRFTWGFKLSKVDFWGND